jgi:hypothetical protein
MPNKQYHRAIVNRLHLLKRGLSSAEEPPMIVGLNSDSPELVLGNLVGSLGDDLPAVVFSNDPITKTHNSLPMVLFRFEILVKPYDARDRSWVAYFFPWVLLNEGMSHKQVDTYDRGGGSKWRTFIS